MNSKAVISTIMAMSLAAGGFAYAQGNDRNDRGRNEQSQRGDQYDRPDNRGPARNDERGAGPNHAYHKGDRLPTAEHHRQYVVDDWRNHHLTAPPRGYHWVQSGNDYVLVAIATGIIARLLLNN